MIKIYAFSIKKSPHINPTYGSPSFIDLTLCDPSSFMEYTWSTYDDVYGNDHYPIIIQNNIITLLNGTQIKQTGKNSANSAQYDS